MATAAAGQLRRSKQAAKNARRNEANAFGSANKTSDKKQKVLKGQTFEASVFAGEKGLKAPDPRNLPATQVEGTSYNNVIDPGAELAARRKLAQDLQQLRADNRRRIEEAKQSVIAFAPDMFPDGKAVDYELAQETESYAQAFARQAQQQAEEYAAQQAQILAQKAAKKLKGSIAKRLTKTAAKKTPKLALNVVETGAVVDVGEFAGLVQAGGLVTDFLRFAYTFSPLKSFVNKSDGLVGKVRFFSDIFVLEPLKDPSDLVTTIKIFVALVIVLSIIAIFSLILILILVAVGGVGYLGLSFFEFI